MAQPWLVPSAWSGVGEAARRIDFKDGADDVRAVAVETPMLPAVAFSPAGDIPVPPVLRGQLWVGEGVPELFRCGAM